MSSRSAFARLRDVARRAQAKPTITWPSTRYQDDPVGFARDVLGVELWSKQVELLEAARDHRRVAASSGHKCGKSLDVAVLALWFYCSFPDARVCITATTARQVDGIIYREIRKLHRRAKQPIDGEVRELARSGIKASDMREIVGFTAKEPEAVAGISGKNLLYLVDEASGIPDVIFEAIDGNCAAGGRVVMISNPTQTTGRFFDAFHAKAEFYKTIQISSEDTPNVITGREVIPGIANREWIAEMKREWGEDSPFYKIRVKGQFVLNDDAKIISIHRIGEAEAAWEATPASGPLRVGVDPAGPGEGGDETTFSARRGMKQTAKLERRGLTEERIVEELLVFLADHRQSREVPAVIIDGEGPIGSKVVRLLRDHLDKHEDAFILVVVYASNGATREPQNYDRIRDELWANGARWLLDGGAILADRKLAQELHCPKWEKQVNGKLKVTPKSEMRKELGRSPDRADAFLLSLWEPMALRPDNEAGPGAGTPPARAYDPYADDDFGGGGGGEISPYGGGLR